jgi:D-alanyl-D-alanine carboxypeptidase (penicillin-binding protein 5/6)
MVDQAARLLDYGFALPRGNPVGHLVAPAPSAPQLTTTAVQAAPAAPPRAGAGIGAAVQRGPLDTGGLVTGLLWLGVAVLVLAGLVALVLRQRRRTHHDS